MGSATLFFMKRINVYFLVLFIGALFGSASLGAQDGVIHCWDFNNGSSSDDWPSPIASAARVVGNGSITHNFSNIEACSGSVSNACTGGAAGTAFCPKGKDENGNSFKLIFSTKGYENIELSFWCLRSSPGNSNSGFQNNTIEYSIDGGVTWVNSTVFAPTQNGSIVNVDFTNIPACNDNEQFQIRITLNGATNPNGANSYDNIKLEGTPIALALPVDLLSFTVNKESGHVILDWTFDNAHELERFDVEHATVQQEWQSIGSVMYHEELGRNKQVQLIHRQPAPGDNYYRLWMVDLDGSQEVSRIESIYIPKMGGVRPRNTKVGHSLFIERLSSSGHESHLAITDLQGRTLHRSTLSADVFDFTIDMSSYPSGVYILRTLTGGDVEVFKVVKE